MKLLTFKQHGSDYLGALTDAGVVNLSAAAEGDSAFSSMQHFIEAGQPALDRAYALLASSSAVISAEQGEWDDTRSVIIEFPSKESALTWMNSDEYQAIAKHRNAGSTVNSILVKGLGG